MGWTRADCCPWCGRWSSTTTCAPWRAPTSLAELTADGGTDWPGLTLVDMGRAKVEDLPRSLQLAQKTAHRRRRGNNQPAAEPSPFVPCKQRRDPADRGSSGCLGERSGRGASSSVGALGRAGPPGPAGGLRGVDSAVAGAGPAEGAEAEGQVEGNSGARGSLQLAPQRYAADAEGTTSQPRGCLHLFDESFRK